MIKNIDLPSVFIVVIAWICVFYIMFYYRKS